MIRAYVGLGGNRGEPAATLRAAAAALTRLPGVAALRLSPLYRSAPAGPVADQPWFVNACAELDFATPPAPLGLLAALLEVEASFGRDRAREIPQGPRTLDLDLLVWGDRVLDLPGPPRLVLPHPRLHERRFALAPLVDLAPHLVIPGHGPTVRLLEQARGEVERI